MSLELAEEGTKFTGQAWSDPIFSFIYPYNHHASLQGFMGCADTESLSLRADC